MHPKVLILDEPTAGLDPRGRDEILDMVRDMKNSLHMTILLVSHSMDDVAEYADRILVMNAGKLMMDGTPTEVFARYRELESFGLAAPQTVYILQYLRSLGLPVDVNRLTPHAAAREICAHIEELNALTGRQFSCIETKEHSRESAEENRADAAKRKTSGHGGKAEEAAHV